MKWCISLLVLALLTNGCAVQRDEKACVLTRNNWEAICDAIEAINAI